VQGISPLVGDAGVSIEVFADLGSRAEEMLLRLPATALVLGLFPMCKKKAVTPVTPVTPRMNTGDFCYGLLPL
jgi:hypothetical protein